MRSLAIVVLCTQLAVCAATESQESARAFAVRKSMLSQLVQVRDWPGAFRLAKQLHAENQDDAELFVLRGVIYREQGLVQEAKQDFLKATEIDGDFAVFLIGMRLNRPWRVDRWAPLALTMVRMLRDLRAGTEPGFLGAVLGLPVSVVYWRFY